MQESIAAGLVRRWLGVALLSLVLAGLSALLLVVGRLPLLGDRIADPLFFKRSLVVHVVLALVVWFLAFCATLFQLLGSTSSPLAKVGPWLALVGMALMVSTLGIPDVEPVLANYIPVLNHPLFLLGLGMVAFAVLLSVVDHRLLPGATPMDGWRLVPPSARIGLRAMALALLFAALTTLGAVGATSTALETAAYFELVFWGGGHVLQFASVAAMLVVWLMLVSHLTGADSLKPRWAIVLFGLFTAPLWAAPLLTLGGTAQANYYNGFTRLMQWGIFPWVLVVVAMMGRHLWRHRELWTWRDVRFVGLLSSVGLTLLGFGLGAAIRGSNTMVPAHYHASLGGVSVAFMTASYVLLSCLRLLPTAKTWRRLIMVQPGFFAVGQGIFALGFGLAGSTGMGRKTYGSEQVIRTLSETLGLSIMGLGGLLAVVAGIVFLCICAAAWTFSRQTTHSRSHPWTIQSLSIPFRN